jgi:hypothetical protein
MVDRFGWLRPPTIGAKNCAFTSATRTPLWKRKKGRLAWAALLAPAAGPISPPSQQPRARLPNQLVDKSYCRCANHNATSLTGKPNPDLSIKYARFPHSPQQLSPQTQRNSIRHPICAGGCGQGRGRRLNFRPSLALLVDGCDSPPQGLPFAATFGSTSGVPQIADDLSRRQTRQPWANSGLSSKPYDRRKLVERLAQLAQATF